MTDPKGNLVTPVGFDGDGVLRGLLLNSEGKLEVVTTLGTKAKCRAYRAADQFNLVSGVWTKVVLDGTTYDPSIMFDTNKIVIAIPGYYFISAQIAFKTGTVVADRVYYTGVYLNGVVKLYKSLHSSLNEGFAVSVIDVWHLANTDDVELYALSIAGVDTVDVLGAIASTFLTVHLFSAD